MRKAAEADAGLGGGDGGGLGDGGGGGDGGGLGGGGILLRYILTYESAQDD